MADSTSASTVTLPVPLLIRGSSLGKTFLLPTSTTEMPGETRRTLRSTKESSSSANGEKARPDSQSTSSSKDKPVPTRAISKGKSFPPKKGSPYPSGKEGPGDKQTNGSEPTENGVNGVEDVEMADDQITPGQGKEGEDEMTVVVPPPKSSTLSGAPTKDDEGDVAMEDTETAENDATVPEKVDPVAKAISGQW